MFRYPRSVRGTHRHRSGNAELQIRSGISLTGVDRLGRPPGRRAGRRAFVSVHILVPGDWSVQRGHDLVERIERDLREALGHATVFTHVEPRGRSTRGARARRAGTGTRPARRDRPRCGRRTRAAPDRRRARCLRRHGHVPRCAERPQACQRPCAPGSAERGREHRRQAVGLGTRRGRVVADPEPQRPATAALRRCSFAVQGSPSDPRRPNPRTPAQRCQRRRSSPRPRAGSSPKRPRHRRPPHPDRECRRRPWRPSRNRPSGRRIRFGACRRFRRPKPVAIAVQQLLGRAVTRRSARALTP